MVYEYKSKCHWKKKSSQMKAYFIGLCFPFDKMKSERKKQPTVNQIIGIELKCIFCDHQLNLKTWVDQTDCIKFGFRPHYQRTTTKRNAFARAWFSFLLLCTVPSAAMLPSWEAYCLTRDRMYATYQLHCYFTIICCMYTKWLLKYCAKATHPNLSFVRLFVRSPARRWVACTIPPWVTCALYKWVKWI